MVVLGMGAFTNTLSFDTTSIQLYQQEFSNLQTLSRYWTPSAYSKIKTLIYNMHEEYENQENAWEFAIATFANLLMLTAIRSLPKRATPLLENTTESMVFQKVITYIADNFESKITLDECAKLCNFNPSYFSKYFKKHMGITFQDYVKSSRLEQAKWLLLTTNISITDIAYQCGFSNLCVFNKLFKQETGVSASIYRKM
ncbi:MAG: AraC family transcriptional regulator [Schaedlerella sp.]